MKIEEAFSIVDGVCSRTVATRQDHATIVEALQTIADGLKKPATEVKPVTEVA